MTYKKEQVCANCKELVRANFSGGVCQDIWCGKHNTNFTPNSKCDFYERNIKL